MTSIAGNRRKAPTFDLAAYAAELESFQAELGEARWALLSGARRSLDSAAIYRSHETLFERSAVDGLLQRAASDGPDARQAAALLPSVVDGYADAKVLNLTDQIAAAEASAVIVWRGERIAYRQAPQRVSQLSDRSERNALEASYLEAVEIINPLREARLDALHAVANELGYADYPAMIGETRGYDVDALAADMQRFLIESETVYFAALRRYLAEIDIEQGDATNADLSHVLAGNGWNAWFDQRRMLGIVRASFAGLGLNLVDQRNITLDVDPRVGKAGGAWVVPVRVPQDVRVALQPASANVDYAAALTAIGQAEQMAHAAGDLPAAYRYGGDQAVSTGFGALFGLLLHDPDWLLEQLRMTDEEMIGWLDFSSFRRLHGLRRDVAQLLYELRLHRGAESALHRAYYAGMLGLLTGVRYAESGYLINIEHGFESATALRGACLASALDSWLDDRHGARWWQSRAAGEELIGRWSRGRETNADALVAQVGYDRLDWRPILRQIRTQLIGEMSGYGGPNITTRAGTRKV
jgi:hypothetical protein